MQGHNKPKSLTVGCKLSDTIAEGMELKTFCADEEGAHEPASPRPRSRSWAEGSIMRPPSGLAPAPGAPPWLRDSTDSKISRYESLPKIYRRSDRHLGRLNTQLMLAARYGDVPEAARLLGAGASAGATCHTERLTACHLAALQDAALARLLLAHGAERARADRLGRTPLHLAAAAGHLRPLAALLALPAELQDRLEESGELTPEIEEEISKLADRDEVKAVVDMRCQLGDVDLLVPKPLRDNVDHCCPEIDVPFVQPGWTALHAAAAGARGGAARALLAAGAEPCARDLLARTPLDVAGSACLAGVRPNRPAESAVIADFTEVIKILLRKSCKRASFKKSLMLDTPLHTAVELGAAEAASLLLRSGVAPRALNRAGLSPLHLCVDRRHTKLLQTFIYHEAGEDVLRFPGLVDAVNKDGYTVLHYAITKSWLAGVCICLEAGANVVHPANNRETPIHTAAALGNLDILKEILRWTKSTDMVDVLNHKGETALYKAIAHGQTDCVKMLLKEGAAIGVQLPRHYNVFHVAARLGCADIMKVLLDHDYTFTRERVNTLTSDDRRGCGPIHFAVEYNHVDCVKLMLSKNAFISLKTSSGVHRESTPLHIAARKNNSEIAKVILKFDATTIANTDSLGWTPLHTASYYGCRDVIDLLILEGSDLSARTRGPHKYQKTVVDIIMENLPKPTEFFESIFDACIHRPSKSAQSVYGEYSFRDPDTDVILDYDVLLPKHVLRNPDVKLDVIEAIIKSGNRSGQKRLLIHPLVESYLCLRWKALLPFFYAMVLIYATFALTLTLFVMTDYSYRDAGRIDDKPLVWDTTFWTYALYLTIAVVLVQEVLFLSADVKHYVVQKETWVKLGSIVLGGTLPPLMGAPPGAGAVDWARHVATMAIVLSWLDMTFLLSRFPNWGYYVLMFGKVCANVVKILLTFAFLVAGFAMSFMIQFHHDTSFESFWAALVKTMVMMSSEFDYDDLVDKNTKNPQLYSLLVIRLVFLLFLILGAVALMNLLVGVAVHDLHNLEVHGHIMRLEKRVEFLASLESLVLRKIFIKLLPSKWIYNLRFSIELRQICLKPCEPSWSYFKAIPAHVRDAIFERAGARNRSENRQVGFDGLRKQLSEIQEDLKKRRGVDSEPAELSRLAAAGRAGSRRSVPLRLTDTDIIVVRMKRQLDDLSAKIDIIMNMMVVKTDSQIRKESV